MFNSKITEMNKEAKSLILLILLSLGSLESFSQNDFRKGFIVTLNLDTIHGFVDYTNPDLRSRTCIFRIDENSQIERYNADELNSYFVSNKIFESKDVNIADSLMPMFVEYLVNGIVDLYFLQFRGRQYFFIEKDGKMYKLSGEDQEIAPDGSIRYRKSNQYIGILSWIMADAKDFRETIYTTEFNHRSLVDLTKKYHDIVCDVDDPECIIYYSKRRSLLDTRWQINIGLSMGYSYSQLSLKSRFVRGLKVSAGSGRGLADQYHFMSTNSDFNSSTTGILPGIFIQLDRNTKYFLLIGFFYQELDHSYLSIRNIHIPLLLDYEITRYRKLTPFFTLGSGININFTSGIEGTHEIITYGENPGGTPSYRPKVIMLEQDFINDKIYPHVSLGLGLKHYQKNRGNFSVRMLCTYAYKKSNSNYNIGPHKGTIFNFIQPSISLSYALPVYVFVPP